MFCGGITVFNPLVQHNVRPMAIAAFPLIARQRTVGGSPSGAPAMLEFRARHGIRPVTEEFPMSRANSAMPHLEAGKARHRIVLKNHL
jgi:uncharacterized zinc-type alcohol dehydrogenase-like protein